MELGVAFEAAAIAGLALFDTDLKGLASEAKRTDERLALLPKSGRRPAVEIDDDF